MSRIRNGIKRPGKGVVAEAIRQSYSPSDGLAISQVVRMKQIMA